MVHDVEELIMPMVTPELQGNLLLLVFARR
jgi:hypothetical protein